jgi:O-antigen/teichoic acid export membrane protein
MNLKSKVKNGLKWTFVDQILSQVIFLVFSIFLARILTPSIFGIVSMVTIFSNFAALFIDLGFSAALIQKKEVTAAHYSSVFWLNVGIGFLMYLIFYISAPLISLFYNQPELTLLIRVICLSFIVSSFASVQANILIKELQFKKKVIINWISMLIGYTLAFIMAYKGYGVWSLVMMTLLTAILNSILYWFVSKWVPLFIFEWKKVKELSHYGLNFLGEASVNYWSRNFDNFIIAKVLGSTDLGIYTRAYSLMLLPLRNVSTIITKVMFPAFSKKQDDIQVLKKYYLSIIQYIALITFPLMIGLSLVSKEFVLLFFGDKWLAMIPVLSILSGLGAIQSIVSLNGLIYNSLGKVNIAFKVSILTNIVLVIAFIIGVNYGLIGVAYSYLIASALLLIPMYQIAIKQINTSLLEVFKTIKGIVLATLLMAIFLLIINYYSDFSILLGLIVKVIIGASVYFLTLLFFEKELLFNLKKKLKI